MGAGRLLSSFSCCRSWQSPLKCSGWRRFNFPQQIDQSRSAHVDHLPFYQAQAKPPQILFYPSFFPGHIFRSPGGWIPYFLLSSWNPFKHWLNRWSANVLFCDFSISRAASYPNIPGLNDSSSWIVIYRDAFIREFSPIHAQGSSMPSPNS